MTIENTSIEGPAAQLLAQNEQLIAQINAVFASSKELGAAINRGTGGRENSLVTTQLQQAFHWALETRWMLSEVKPDGSSV